MVLLLQIYEYMRRIARVCKKSAIISFLCLIQWQIIVRGSRFVGLIRYIGPARK